MKKRIRPAIELFLWSIIGDVVGLLIVSLLYFFIPRPFSRWHAGSLLVFLLFYDTAILWVCWKHSWPIFRMIWYPIFTTGVLWFLIGGFAISYYPPRYYEFFQGYMLFLYIAAITATAATMLGAFITIHSRHKNEQY